VTTGTRLIRGCRCAASGSGNVLPQADRGPPMTASRVLTTLACAALSCASVMFQAQSNQGGGQAQVAGRGQVQGRGLPHGRGQAQTNPIKTRSMKSKRVEAVRRLPGAPAPPRSRVRAGQELGRRRWIDRRRGRLHETVHSLSQHPDQGTALIGHDHTGVNRCAMRRTPRGLVRRATRVILLLSIVGAHDA